MQGKVMPAEGSRKKWEGSKKMTVQNSREKRRVETQRISKKMTRVNKNHAEQGPFACYVHHLG